jgi:hypothetical protein
MKKYWKSLGLMGKLVIIVAFAAILYMTYRKVRLEIWGVYTIGTLTEITRASHGTLVKYTFSYNGQEYESQLRLNVGKSDLGSKYFVQFLDYEPDVNFLVMDGRVPNCLLSKEPKVWREIPQCR